MSNNQVLTVKDVIDMSINELRQISVPADLLDSMGPHISNALRNLVYLTRKFEEDALKPITDKKDEPKTEKNDESDSEGDIDISIE